MKSISDLNHYKAEFFHLFENTQDIENLSAKLKQLFLKILSSHPYMRLPNFDIVATESLQDSIWYQDPQAMTETLNIRQNKCDLYLWRCVDQKWYLDDLYHDVSEITEQILKSIPVFHSIPENPKEVKTLFENDLMDFKPETFPKFSEKIPNDINEVLTWDERFLLVGTNVENLKIYSLKEWSNLISRASFYKYI